MAQQHQSRDENEQQNSSRQNPDGGATQQTSAPNEKDESISTAGDYALGKGSKTDIRKDEKEANDNYDHGRQA